MLRPPLPSPPPPLERDATLARSLARAPSSPLLPFEALWRGDLSFRHSTGDANYPKTLSQRNSPPIHCPLLAVSCPSPPLPRLGRELLFVDKRRKKRHRESAKGSLFSFGKLLFRVCRCNWRTYGDRIPPHLICLRSNSSIEVKNWKNSSCSERKSEIFRDYPGGSKIRRWRRLNYARTGIDEYVLYM